MKDQTFSDPEYAYKNYIVKFLQIVGCAQSSERNPQNNLL